MLGLALCRYVSLPGTSTELFPLLAPLDPGQGEERSLRRPRVAFECRLSDLAREIVFQLGFENRVKILNEK